MPLHASDCYKVDVIHFLNPHLIWIEVCDTNVRNEDFIFEQVGVYGVLPINSSLDVEDEGIKYEKCQDWVVAAATTMRNVLSNNTGVWFSPTYIDKRSSIFDDNIHKYGEFIVKLESGECIKLSKLLIEANIAYFNTTEFHIHLSSGLLNTKLSTKKIQEVVRAIEKYYISANKNKKNTWKKSIDKQTSTFNMSQVLENDLSVLTVTNLEKHNNKMLNMVLENKLRDFELCKDIDEVSIGRGVVKSMKKKTDSLKDQNKCNHQVSSDITQSFGDIKAFLDSNAKINQDQESQSDSKSTNSKLNNPYLLKKLNAVKLCKQSKFGKESDDQRSDVNGSVRNNNEKNIHQEETLPQNLQYSNKVIGRQAKSTMVSYKPAFKDSSPNSVAFGPPGIDPMSLKVFPSTDLHQNSETISRDVTKDDSPVKYIVSDDDSHVDLNVNKCNNLSNLSKNVKCGMSPPKESRLDWYQEKRKYKNSNDLSIQNTSHIGNKESGGAHSLLIKKKLKAYENLSLKNSSFSSSDTSNKDTSSSDVKIIDESITDIVKTISENYNVIPTPKKLTDSNDFLVINLKNNVNPFKNIDPNISVFVDKLVSPVLMVHTKHNKRIQPVFEMRDVFFNSHIHIVLRNMSIQHPMMLQTISWNTILRGYSLFMINPPQSGKTLGYLPAVCRLVSDMNSGETGGPSCVIVCATAKSVVCVEELAKMFLGLDDRVLACYAGVDDLYIISCLLNGCDLLITTPSSLTRLLQMKEYGVDLRRLSLFVLDDCERLSSTYMDEIKFFLQKIKETLRSRANNELKVQYILASRVWCDFMEPLAKKAPDTVISIGAFQECILYSKSSTSVSIVKIENKIDAVFNFLKEIDNSKRVVIVCKSDDEVVKLEKALKSLKHTIFSCNNEMTVHDLFNLSISWADYDVPLVGPMLICCDGNLTHMNITDAHYLIHFSLPPLFSMFCKRFCVLNDNYPSIFANNNEHVKIKILLDDNNVKQLPKVMNFIKRCTTDIPNVLDELCDSIFKEKELVKAKNYIPICDNLLIFGNCPDIYNCQERHAIFKEYDTPDNWVPKDGIITFKILHYHTATSYSARLFNHTLNGVTTKFPQTHSTLSTKLGIYYSKESNRKLHGIPKIGDICAVSLTLNLFRRCQVVKILTEYENGNPNNVLVNLIDDEKYEISKDVYLYHLPNELKDVKANVVRIRLVNIKPKDKDVTFSGLACSQLKKITEQDSLFARGQVIFALGNCVFVETLEACQVLTSLNRTVVKCDLKMELLDNHAQLDTDQVQTIQRLCNDSGMEILRKETQVSEISKPVKDLPKGEWAFLESDTLSTVFLSAVSSPEKFFVCLVKFHSCMKLLLQDIQLYANNYNRSEELYFKEGDLVLAEWPEDAKYERARIDRITGLDVECFFVDQGDWKEVSLKKIIPITNKLINQLPFQAIECRLIGVEPPAKNWPEMSLNWFYDNCYEDINGSFRTLYIQRFSKETAEFTNGYKYGVALISTHTDKDIVINEVMIDLNLARLNHLEEKYLHNGVIDTIPIKNEEDDSDVDDLERISQVNQDEFEIIPKATEDGVEKIPEVIANGTIVNKASQVLFPSADTNLIRSVPLVSSDDDDFEKWDGVGFSTDLFQTLLGGNQKTESHIHKDSNEKENFVPENTKLKQIMDDCQKSRRELDSDDFSTSVSSSTSNALKDSIKEQTPRRPKLVWRQNGKNVTIKIHVIDVQEYEIQIDDRAIKFNANVKDTAYAFDIELFGVVVKEKYSHYKTGMYIVVKLVKVLNRNWIRLSTKHDTKGFITYDVDAINDDDDDDGTDDEVIKNDVKNIIIENRRRNDSSESDDGFMDDIQFSYHKD